MDPLPSELLRHVFSYHSVADLTSVALVCQRFYHHATSLLFTRAVLEDRQQITTPDQWPLPQAANKPITRLPFTLRIVASGRMRNIHNIVGAGAHLGCFLVPNCNHGPWLCNYRNPADEQCKQPSTSTPLHVAAAQRHTQAAVYIASIIPRAHVDMMAFKSCLCPSRHLGLLFHDHGIFDRAGMPSATALHTALAHDADDDLVMLLIRCGAAWDLPLTAACGLTAFHLMAANGRTGVLTKMVDMGLVGRDWPDHQGLRALHYATCSPVAESDDAEAKRLVNALIRLGAQPDTSSDDKHSHDGLLMEEYTEGLVTAFTQGNDGSGGGRLLDPTGSQANRPWLPSDYLMPSGAVIDVDADFFSTVPVGPRLVPYATGKKKYALAKALRALYEASLTIEDA